MMCAYELERDAKKRCTHALVGCSVTFFLFIEYLAHHNNMVHKQC